MTAENEPKVIQSNTQERIIPGGLIVNKDTNVGSIEHFKTLPKDLQKKIREADANQQQQEPHL